MGELLKKFAEKYEDYRAERGFTCDCCGKEIFTYPETRLCEDCKSAMPAISRRCPKCGRSAPAEGVCLECKERMPLFDFALSAYAYEGKAASLINRMKNGEKFLAYFFAEALAPLLETALKNEGIQQSECVFTCVPDRKRDRIVRRGRRYNPAAALAVKTCALLNVPADDEIMVKSRETKPQKRMSAKERFENVRGAYRVHKRTAVEGKTAVVFDDILTTGATGSECARILLAAGAKRVIFVSAVSVAEKNTFPAFAQ
ncbi:MAG: ComF family protein [Candidatus Scatosoma sp.]